MGGFGNSATQEVTEFDEFSFEGIVGGKLIECFVDCKEFAVLFYLRQLIVVRVLALCIPTVSNRLFAASLIDKDPPHRFSGGSEEVTTVGEAISIGGAS